MCYKVNYINTSDWYTVNDLEEVQEILDQKEKEYLSGVIRPFKNGITGICKQECITKIEVFPDYISSVATYYIEIYCNYGDHLVFPKFEKGEYYNNMEVGKEYTLKELGLEEN